jgi:rsbT co-antagonist protein RsbR
MTAVSQHPEEELSSLRADLESTIEEILVVLNAAESGDVTGHLKTRFEEDHPAGVLTRSVNQLMAALRTAREESADRLNELSARLDLIERQREAIQTLSVPVIEVWQGVLCVPIVGILDNQRAAHITESMMNAVVRSKSRYVVIDLTAVDVMDTTSTDHFLRMARSVRMLGARCALSGMHPNIAQAVVHMGLDLGGLRSFRTMREALKFCVAWDARKRK